jgi:glycerophosphoryl diester phosphodiesterase
MTILIAHRGNYDSVNPEFENTLPYIWKAIEHGYDVEVDIWLGADGLFRLGHDAPGVILEYSDLLSIRSHTWFHAKNYDALVALADRQCIVFAHDQDPFTITSTGIPWSHRGQIAMYGIACMPDLETEHHIVRTAYGVCHDRLDMVEQILTDSHSN